MKGFMMKIIKIIALLLVVQFSACTYMPPRISEPEEAKAVAVYTTDEGLPSDCKALGEVVGYGGNEKEAMFDIRYNAAVDFEANGVMIKLVDEFYQNKRMKNFTREPPLFARKGTTNYKYIHAFKFEAQGMAVKCKSVK